MEGFRGADRVFERDLGGREGVWEGRKGYSGRPKDRVIYFRGLDPWKRFLPLMDQLILWVCVDWREEKSKQSSLGVAKAAASVRFKEVSTAAPLERNWPVFIFLGCDK